MLINEEDYMAHVGTPRHSGRYPWGSGAENTPTRNKSFLDYAADLHKQGLKEADIAEGFGYTIAEYRAKKSAVKDEIKQNDIGMAVRLSDKGMSNKKIGERMAIDGVPRNESSIRLLLKASKNDKVNILRVTSEMLEAQVAEKTYVDVGSGVENHLGISQTKLGVAVFLLKEKGYVVETVLTDQVMGQNKTKTKVLAPPWSSYKDIKLHKNEIQQITAYSENGGRRYTLGIAPPLSVSSKRIAVRWFEDGGGNADGVIYVRPGAKNLSLGKTNYAQVRIKVDGTHYLKGMAMHKDDLPTGIDLVFNTKKPKSGSKLDAMKELKKDKQTGEVDQENPFGSVVRQIFKKDKNGEDTDVLASAMNLVNEAGNWGDWSKNLSSQMLSKQSPTLAKAQLSKTYEAKKKDLDEIMALTNPAVRKKLLETCGDEADKSAVHLKAAALPHMGTHVILPINSMKQTEVYAPNFVNGERVVLIRYPHGGIFEIPELTVNNRHPEARKLIGEGLDAPDAIGIHSKVAERLSGADFDGDTVLVIPNNNRLIKTEPALERLKNFDPQREYPYYEGMTRMSVAGKGMHMGLISNLITDMSIMKASTEEKARAVRHSMVVIDAEKHGLNYKKSALDHNIKQLKIKYQGTPQGRASTLISKRKSPLLVPKRIPRRARNGGPVDPKTGEKVYELVVPGSFVNKQGKTVYLKTKTTKLADAKDAHTLMSKPSGTLIETVYADHSNKLKALANTARREAVNTPNAVYSESANKAYSAEVDSLNGKLNTALKNRPLERQANIIANANIKIRQDANPDMDDAELRKLERMALEAARTRTGAQPQRIMIEDHEWDAIQAGAIHDSKLKDILKNADLKRVRELATPRTHVVMTPLKKQRALSMLANGTTQADVANALGVSLTTLKRELKGVG